MPWQLNNAHNKFICTLIYRRATPTRTSAPQQTYRRLSGFALLMHDER